jgi:hypothetical protein
MFRPCWVIFRENFFVIIPLRLHFIVEWECAVDCVLCTGGVNCLRSRPALHCSAMQAGTTEGSRLQKQRSTQSTAHSHSTIKCNLSVTITKSAPWRWPTRVETCRSVLRLMIKFSLCICWWLVFLYFLSLLFLHIYLFLNLWTPNGREKLLQYNYNSWKYLENLNISDCKQIILRIV